MTRTVRQRAEDDQRGRVKNAGQECKHDGCHEDAVCKGYCLKHYQRVRNHPGDSSKHASGGRPGVPIPANSKGDLASYGALHIRVSYARGPAKDQPCVDADGTCNAGRDWSNDTGNYGDINDFSVRCHVHHRAYDAERPDLWAIWVDHLPAGTKVQGADSTWW